MSDYYDGPRIYKKIVYTCGQCGHCKWDPEVEEEVCRLTGDIVSVSNMSGFCPLDGADEFDIGIIGVYDDD